MRRKIISLFLSLITAFSCVYSVSAAPENFTVHVNSVIQLGDNVVVGSNAISESDLLKKYNESKEKLASSYSNVDTNRGHLFDDILSPSDSGISLPSDTDLNSQSDSLSNRKSLTLEEFKDLLGDQVELPEDNPLTDYEEELKKKQDKQKDKNKITADYMKDFYDKIRNGINPFTGEPFDEDDDFVDENEEARKAAQENMQLTAPGGWNPNGGDAGSGGSAIDDQFQQNLDEMSDFMKNQYEDQLKAKNYSSIKHEKLDKSEYENDELVYDKKNKSITDIHYRCSKCGELYGFDKFCNCDRPKYLDGEVYQYASDNKGFNLGWNFKGFNDKGEAKNKSLWSSTLTCGMCGKKFTLDSLDFKATDDDKFYIGSNGVYKCHECQNQYGGGADKLNYYEDHPEELFPGWWPEWADPEVIDDIFKDFMSFANNNEISREDVLTKPYRDMFLTFIKEERAVAEDVGNTDDIETFDAIIQGIESSDPENLKYESVDVERNWSKYNPHFEDFISPCTPLLPDNSDIVTDDDMFAFFLSTVPEEKREEFSNLRDTFINGSDKDIQDAFLNTIKSEESWVLAMNMMLMYEQGGPKAAFNIFMSSIPEDKQDQFKNIKTEFESGDENAAFNDFLNTIKSEDAWNTTSHLFDKYKNEGMDSAFEYFLDNVPEENRAQYREEYNKFKNSGGSGQTLQQPQQNIQQRKQKNDKLIEEYAKKYYPDNNKPMEEWTAEDYEEMYKKMLEDFNKSVPPAKKQKGKKIKETKKMDDAANKIFAEWTDDQSEWTQEQWNTYNGFCEKYGHDETYLDMVDKGVFDADKSPDEVANAIDKYIAGFTSVSDMLTLVTTVDYTDIEDIGQGGSYDVKGNTRAIVKDDKGKVVAERESVGGMPMTWVAYETGHYTVHRYVDVYHIEWSFKKCTAVMNAEVILPDGTPVTVISGHEETRIIENKDGFKQTNCKTIKANSFSVTVVEDDNNTDKADFYDTERVK